MVKHEWSSDELKHKAEAYCANAEHCCSEVKNKLQQWGADDDTIDNIICFLLSQKYIDENRYCKAFAHDKVNYQGWGRIKIRAALYAKQLPQHCINYGIDAIDETEYFNALKKVIASKKRAIKSNDPMAREKLIRFCLQRGFSYDEIGDLL